MSSYAFLCLNGAEELFYLNNLFTTLLDHNKATKIYLLTLERNKPFLNYINGISDTYYLPDSNFSLLLSLKKLPLFDFYIDVDRTFFKRSRLIAILIKAKQKIGYSIRFKHYPFNLPLSKKKADSLIDHYQKSLDLLGVARTYRLSFKYQESDQVREFIKTNRLENYILVNPGSRDDEKWSENSYSKIMLNVLLYNHKIIFIKSQNYPQEFWDFCEKQPNILLYNSEKLDDLFYLSQLAFITISTAGLLAIFASSINKALIVLESNLDARKLYKIKSALAYIVKPREIESGIPEIQFDSVLQAIRKLKDDLYLTT